MNKKPIRIELRYLDNIIKRKFDDFACRNQIESVSGTNGWIIGFLAENSDKDIYQKDLEKHFTITRSTVSKVLNLMEKKGLIERRNVQYDSRLKKLMLTEKAWKIAELMKDYGDRLEGTLTKDFNKEELDSLYGYIQRMKDNIQ